MKILTLLLLLCLPLLAQTSRETFRDSTGRIVKTIEYRKIHNGTQAVIRDASGRIIGTQTTIISANGSSSTIHRDASGRIVGSSKSTKRP
jgi:hypothetical protein